MKHLKVAIVAHSEIGWLSKEDLKLYSHIIGVDRGAFVLLEKGIVPDVAIGDFDSVTKAEMNTIRTKVHTVKEYQTDKDQTDLELAVMYALGLSPTEITLFGVTGGRLDQSLAALHLLQKIHEYTCRAILQDAQNFIILISGKYHIQKKKKYHYISILPYTDTIIVSITGCTYNLEKHAIKKGMTLGVSNVVISDKAEIQIHSGVAYCVFSKDKENI
jgi:thiamine pyrophosphokinase